MDELLRTFFLAIFLLPSTSALADYGEDLKKRDEIASQQNQPNSSSSTKYNPSVTTSSETTSPTDLLPLAQLMISQIKDQLAVEKVQALVT